MSTVLGVSLPVFTQFHVVLSLIGIASGFVALRGMAGNRWLEGWNVLFLTTTLATSLTGFLFPASAVLPSHIFGVIVLVALGAAVAARYRFGLMGRWRLVYIVAAVLSQYLNVFVAVVQAFLKLPPLQPLAPTQSEPPFLIAQLIVLAGFVIWGTLIGRRYHPVSALARP